MPRIKKSTIYAGFLVALMILTGFIFYAMIGGHHSSDIGLNGSINSVNIPDNWAISGIGPVSDIHVDDGTLYAFMGNSSNTIYAIDLNGSVRWTYNVSDGWRVKNAYYYGTNFTDTRSVYKVNNGVLYLYIRENRTTFWNHLPNEDHPDQPQAGDWNLEDRLMAISPNGSLLWEVPISKEHHIFGDVKLEIMNGRLYAFDNNTITVFNDRGSPLYQIRNASSWSAIDENGYVYAVPAALLNPQPTELVDYYREEGYMVPSNAVEAYDPEGDQRWHIGLDAPVVSSPLYQNGTLWVPVQNGVMALNTDGTIKWSKHYDIAPAPIWGGSIGLYAPLPLDSRGNMYLYEAGVGDPLGSKKSIHIITIDGNETVRGASSFTPYEPGDSIQYKTQFYYGGGLTMDYTEGHTTVPVDEMMNCTVIAYDAADNKNLWSYTIVPSITDTIITGDNWNRLVNPKYRYKNASPGTFIDWSPVGILRGNDTVFAIYSCANIISPIGINQSKCGYFIGIYAFDKKDGRLLWTKTMDTLIISSDVYDNTVYYGTLDGKIALHQVG